MQNFIMGNTSVAVRFATLSSNDVVSAAPVPMMILFFFTFVFVPTQS
jgi:hypothetical protein